MLGTSIRGPSAAETQSRACNAQECGSAGSEPHAHKRLHKPCTMRALAHLTAKQFCSCASACFRPCQDCNTAFLQLCKRCKCLNWRRHKSLKSCDVKCRKQTSKYQKQDSMIAAQEDEITKELLACMARRSGSLRS